jgi:purine catabolism regulator
MRHDHRAFCLNDLLDCRELGLKLVAGSEKCGTRRVRGAHCADVPHPGPWLDHDWVLLTTGGELGRSDEFDRGYVLELVDANVAALGFALDVVHSDVPPTILETASKRGLPLFTVPFRTPFREITSLVFNAVSSPEIRASRRLVAMQRFLMDALNDDPPREGLVHRLASLLDARVGLANVTGSIEFETSPLPAQAIVEAIHAAAHGTVLTLNTPRLHGFALAIGDEDGRAGAWLVLMWPIARPIPALAKAVAHLAISMLEAISRLSRTSSAEKREMCRATLAAVFEPDSTDNERMLSARCRAYGLDLAGGVCAIAVGDSAAEVGDRVLYECEAALERVRAPFMAALAHGQIALLLPAPVTDEFVSVNLLHSPTMYAGIGRVAFDGVGTAESWTDAQLAATEHTEFGTNQIIRYDDLDLMTVLLHELPLDRLRPKVSQLLDALHSNKALYDTLVTYLRLNQDVSRTARSLCVHPNSVRYRLGRVEAIVGRSIRSPAALISLQVALTLDKTTPERSELTTAALTSRRNGKAEGGYRGAALMAV